MSPQKSLAKTKQRNLGRLIWGLVYYTVLIIVWGAWVRISGSGDGCGDHWPLCNGVAIPTDSSTPVKTWIEISHRYSTALFGILVLALIVKLYRITDKAHPARSWGLAILVFTVTEALLGRLLVKEGLVNESHDLARLFIMPLHLVNTSLLLISQVFCAESLIFALSDSATYHPREGRNKLATLGLVVGLLLLLTSGAIAALGSHLLPATSLEDGLIRDLSVASHPAVRLRIIHPLLGLLLPPIIWLMFSKSAAQGGAHATQMRAASNQFGIALALMVVLGVLTLLLLSPTWLKLAHLVVANFVVITAGRLLFFRCRDRG
jgi:cytochrome c oxidase assembly protein subunit 15